MFTKTKLVLGALLLLAVAGGSAYAVYRYEDMSQTIIAQKETLKANQEAIDNDLRVIKQDAKDLNDQQQIRDSLDKTIRTQAGELSDLQRRFKTTANAVGSKDLGQIALVKPGLVQVLVNKGTSDTMRCFEILSGQPLTDGEQNATKPSEENSSCPDLANPHRGN